MSPQSSVSIVTPDFLELYRWHSLNAKTLSEKKMYDVNRLSYSPEYFTLTQHLFVHFKST